VEITPCKIIIIYQWWQTRDISVIKFFKNLSKILDNVYYYYPTQFDKTLFKFNKSSLFMTNKSKQNEQYMIDISIEGLKQKQRSSL